MKEERRKFGKCPVTTRFIACKSKEEEEVEDGCFDINGSSCLFFLPFLLSPSAYLAFINGGNLGGRGEKEGRGERSLLPGKKMHRCTRL